MAIWSLTQERVEKLQRQIGDKEMEIDALQKLTPRDLWTRDLDDFVEEWNLQLDDEAKRKKKIAGMSRRASNKLGLGASKGGKRKKKRAGSDSDSDEFSDYGPAKKKAKPKTGGLLGYLKKDPEEPKKPEVSKPAATKQSGLLSYLKKSPPVEEDAMDVDEPVPAAPAPAAAAAAASKRGRPAAKNVKKPTPVLVDSDSDSDVFAAVAKEGSKKKPTETVTKGRAARGAAKKATSYAVDKDSDSDGLSDDDFDVSMMVKTIGASGNDRPLFSAPAARPGSATGAASKLNGRTTALKPTLISDDDDMEETNYEALAQGSPVKRNMDAGTDSDISDDDLLLSVKKKAPVKVIPKAKAAPKPKAPAASTLVAKKITQRSPAAKAYAARLGKTKESAPKVQKPIAVDSDEEEDELMGDDADKLANDILSDDEDDMSVVKSKPRPAAARPGRRAAAKPAKYVISDDDEDDEPSEASFGEDSE
jgi:DNA topoisomerase-2